MNEFPFDRLQYVVNRPEWDMFLVYIANKKDNCIDRLERCSPEDLKRIQGELSILKDILTLRDSVNKYMSNRGTKTQS